jgi:hypothetical protein
MPSPSKGDFMSYTRALLLAGFASACAFSSITAADAGPRERYARAYGPIEGYVVAESRFGNGSVTGPVRRGRYTYEVQMPGGTWIECRRLCSETLRVETVDFWENKGGGRDRIDNECGVLGCLTWSRSFW